MNITGFQSYAYSLSWPRQRRQKDIVFLEKFILTGDRKPALYFTEETEKGQESSFYVWLRDTIRAIIKRLFHVNVPMILVNKRLDYCREKFWGRITLNTALNIKPYFWIENVFLKKIKKTIKSFAPFTSVVWTVEKIQSYVELVEQNKTDRLFGFHIQIKGLGHKRGKQLRQSSRSRIT